MKKWLGVSGWLLVVAATAAVAAPLLHLTDLGVLKFDVADTGRVSIGSTLATGERVLLEDRTPGEKTFTVRSVSLDGTTMLDRLSLEKNAAEPYDLNLRNMTINVGNPSAASSMACPILNYTPPGSFGGQYTIYKPGSGTVPALQIMATGQIRSYVQGITTNALAVGNYGDAQYKFLVDGTNGAHSWGPGGATAPDTTLARTAPSTLTVTGTLVATGSLQGNLIGPVNGSVTGNVAGNLTGNVTGNVTGNLTGRQVLPVHASAASETLTGSEGLVVVDTTVGVITETLPTAVGRTGDEITVKRGGSGSNDCNVVAALGEGIDGSPSRALKSPYAGLALRAYGGNWLIVQNLGTVQ